MEVAQWSSLEWIWLYDVCVQRHKVTRVFVVLPTICTALFLCS